MRNRTVQSVLARRSMNNGGMVAPPTQASGILRSSPSLIDAVSNDALSDMGGGTLSMAQGGAAVNMQPSYVFNQGGIARYAHGGSHRYENKVMPTAATMMQARPTQQVMDAAPPVPDALTVDRMPAGIKVGESQFIPVETTVSEIINESPLSRYKRIFNPDIDPDSIKNPLPPGKDSRFDKMMFGISNKLKGAASSVGDVYDYAMEPGSSDKTLDQISAINTMVRRRPDLSDTIVDFSNKLIQQYKERGEEITSRDLSVIVAGALSEQQEDVGGYDPNSRESRAGYAAVGDGGAQEYLDSMSSPLSDDEKFEASYKQEAEELEQAEQEEQNRLSGMGAVGDGNIAQMTEDSDRLSGMGAVGPGVADSSPQSVVPGTSTSTDAEPQKSQISPEIMAEISENEPGQKPPSPAAVSEEASKTIQQIKDAAENNDPEKVKKGMKDYIAEFKAAMPEYEGKTEYESGMDIVKMGMAVASGQSPNAIENISKGVLATIDNFTSDDKEKRKYKQQIGLSGAKYALQKLAKDDENALSLAKENRGFKQFIVKTPFTEGGVDYKTGSIYQTTTGAMREDNFSSVLPNLTTEGIYKKIIDDKAAAAALIQKAIAPKRLNQGKGAPTTKGLISSFEEYNIKLNGLETSSRMLTMLDSSIVTNAKGLVTGFAPAISESLNSFANSIGMKKELQLIGNIGTKQGRESKAYTDKQQVIANMMLREILGEGSKNVSNIDRQLAQEIVGLMTDMQSITADPVNINARLQRIKTQVESGVERDIRSLGVYESGWSNIVDGNQQFVDQQFKKARRSVMGKIRGGSSKSENWKVPVSKRAPLLFKDFFDMSTMKQTKKITR